LAFGLALALVVSGCAEESEIRTRTAEERGAALFADARISANAFNPFSCATCHATSDVADGRLLPGGSLAGVTARTSFWGGQETSLLESVNVCLRSFQSDAKGLAAEDDRAASLYAYLVSLKGPSTPVPFTVVEVIADVPNGDASRGAAVWEAACASCHGARHTGAGRLSEIVTIVPEATIAEHVPKGDDVRLIVIEKIRHGSFLGYSGRMPPFSIETLNDQQLGDVLAFLGLDR
jgi:thiosulfate dehydrogenase